MQRRACVNALLVLALLFCVSGSQASDSVLKIVAELDPYCENGAKAVDLISNAHQMILASKASNKENMLELAQRLRNLTNDLHRLYRNYPQHMRGKNPPAFNLIAALYASSRATLLFPPDRVQAAVLDSFKKERVQKIKPKPKIQPKPKSSWGDRFQQLAGPTRALIKRSDDTILQVSLGGGSGMWHLIVEVARNTATQYARTVGDNALYIMEHKFAEFGPADYEVEVQRAGTPWDSKTYVSTIWKGIKRKGERRVQWEQVIGDERAIRERKGKALRSGETFDSVYDSIFSPPKSK